MSDKASKLLHLLKEYESGEDQESEIAEQLTHVSVIAPVLEVMNDLLKEHLLEDYAIGGGIAVLYYTEPVLTYDFDVICVFPQSGVLVDPTPVFTYLKGKGYLFGEEDRVNIEGIPVQFIPVSEGLVEEAIKNAKNVTISGVQTKILTVEYLVAIMLQLNRPKDRAKIDLLINNDEVSVDMSKMQQILTTYGLTKKWERFKDVE
jgi:hypothetical protein